MTVASQDSVRRPVLRYFGGKWMMARWIIERLPEHRCYVEPFMGAASVLLRKDKVSVEVLNDRSGDVVNFFRVVREHAEDLHRQLELTPYAEDEFDDCRAPSEDPIERARRFFVRSWMGFGGSSHCTAWRGFRRNQQRDLAREFVGATDNVLAVAARLRGATIENRDWSVIVDKYDRPSTVFYVDPPYLHRTRAEQRACKGYGDNELSDGDHMALIDRLNDCRAAVALSGYADIAYDLRLAGWQRYEREVKGLQNGGRTEVLWVRPSRGATR